MNGRRVTGRQGRSLNSGTVHRREPEQRVETDRRPSAVDLVGRDLQLARQDIENAGRSVMADLEPHDLAEAALRELELDSLEQVVGIVREREVSIARHAKDGQRLDRPADHVVEEVNDQVLDQDTRASRADADEPGHAVGDVDADETPLARGGVDHDRGDVQRERRDVAGTAPPEPTAIGVSSGAISRSNRFVSARCSRGVHSSNDTMRMPSAASAGRRTSSHSASWSAFRASTRCSRLLERLPRGASIGRAALDLRLDLFAGPGHAHGEELVEVRRDDPAQLHALEQRDAGIRRELEHPPVEVEPRQLAVEEPIGRRRSRSRLAQRAQRRVACGRDRYMPSSAVIRPSRTASTTTL